MGKVHEIFLFTMHRSEWIKIVPEISMLWCFYFIPTEICTKQLTLFKDWRRTILKIHRLSNRTIVIHHVNLSMYKMKRLIPCYERRRNVRLLQHQMQGPSMPILVFCWQLAPFRIIAEIRPKFKKNRWELSVSQLHS